MDTLNGDEFTVFAPVDDAFAKIDPATIEVLKTDSALLTSILTYHVVPGQVLPADIPGTHTTVNGADLEVTGSGDDLMVNGQAAVICGGVQTANATVYLIDTVLMPPAAVTDSRLRPGLWGRSDRRRLRGGVGGRLIFARGRCSEPGPRLQK